MGGRNVKESGLMFYENEILVILELNWQSQHDRWYFRGCKYNKVFYVELQHTSGFSNRSPSVAVKYMRKVSDIWRNIYRKRHYNNDNEQKQERCFYLKSQ